MGEKNTEKRKMNVSFDELAALTESIRMFGFEMGFAVESPSGV